jgi:hypothetical protein
MSKTFAVVLVAALVFAGAASAGGGSPAEPMPGTNFTDIPSYSPRPIVPAKRARHVPRYDRFGRDH